MGRFPEMLAEARYKIEALKQPVEQIREASQQVERIAEMEAAPGRPQQMVLEAPGLLESLFGNISLIGIQLLLILVILYFLLATGSIRSEEHTSELQSLMRISYAVFCLKKKKK